MPLDCDLVTSIGLFVFYGCELITLVLRYTFNPEQEYAFDWLDRSTQIAGWVQVAVSFVILVVSLWLADSDKLHTALINRHGITLLFPFAGLLVIDLLFLKLSLWFALQFAIDLVGYTALVSLWTRTWEGYWALVTLFTWFLHLIFAAVIITFTVRTLVSAEPESSSHTLVYLSLIAEEVLLMEILHFALSVSGSLKRALVSSQHQLLNHQQLGGVNDEGRRFRGGTGRPAEILLHVRPHS